MLCLAALGEEGVNLINEYHSRLVAPGDCKESSHHLLSLTNLSVVNKTESEYGTPELQYIYM